MNVLSFPFSACSLECSSTLLPSGFLVQLAVSTADSFPECHARPTQDGVWHLTNVPGSLPSEEPPAAADGAIYPLPSPLRHTGGPVKLTDLMREPAAPPGKLCTQLGWGALMEHSPEAHVGRTPGLRSQLSVPHASAKQGTGLTYQLYLVTTWMVGERMKG